MPNKNCSHQNLYTSNARNTKRETNYPPDLPRLYEKQANNRSHVSCPPHPRHTHIEV